MQFDEASDSESEDYDADSESGGGLAARLGEGYESPVDWSSLFAGHFSPAKPSPGRRLALSTAKRPQAPVHAAADDSPPVRQPLSPCVTPPRGGTVAPPA